MAAFDRDAGLAEYHEALAKAKESARVAPSSVSHRVRGAAAMVFALLFLLGAAAMFYGDWYAPTHGTPATGTITEVGGRGMQVAFTTAEGVPQTGSTETVSGARVGGQLEILYMEGPPSTEVVQVWNAATPPSLGLAVISSLVGLIALAVGLVEFSGRAPWRDAVVLDETSITARSDRT
ncbi:hypothetical protein FDA94_16450 [Herbidospora galbida]|uniref:DUF3592 domain-containing protein n=1 Tax=Herbidospora galbida TaxID=2575442 RepID=A0A4U3MIH3_9ACTN|nr:hypothetical protein [Herbidospora galbida]TKK87766.1 hypothetical protein FDA94_16450 [Herbidospora galbida]